MKCKQDRVHDEDNPIHCRLLCHRDFLRNVAGRLAFKCSPATCCNRALMGAVITYVAVSWAGTIVYRLLLNAMIESRVRKAAGGNRK